MCVKSGLCGMWSSAILLENEAIVWGNKSNRLDGALKVLMPVVYKENMQCVMMDYSGYSCYASGYADSSVH